MSACDGSSQFGPSELDKKAGLPKEEVPGCDTQLDRVEIHGAKSTSTPQNNATSSFKSVDETGNLSRI